MFDKSTGAEYSSGIFPNVVSVIATGNAKNGTKWNKNHTDDVWGIFQAALDAVGFTPNGTREQPGSSQFLDAIEIIAYNFVVNNVGSSEVANDSAIGGVGGTITTALDYISVELDDLDTRVGINESILASLPIFDSGNFNGVAYQGNAAQVEVQNQDIKWQRNGNFMTFTATNKLIFESGTTGDGVNILGDGLLADSIRPASDTPLVLVTLKSVSTGISILAYLKPEIQQGINVWFAKFGIYDENGDKVQISPVPGENYEISPFTVTYALATTP